MFGAILNLVKDVVTVPVAVAADVVNVATLGALDEDRDETFTEASLKKVGESVDKVIDSEL